MKKMILVLAMLFGSGVAQADEVKKPDEPVHVTLVSVDTTHAGANVKISPSDYPKGVFVRVKEMFGERPVSASIFAGKLRAQGFKIVEKAEDADVVFIIRSSTLNFKDIDANTDSIAANKADGVAGLVGAAVLTGGLSLLVSDYSFLSNKKPVYTDMSIRIEPSKEDKFTLTAATIKTDASNSKVTRVSFEIMADEWIKAHLSKAESVQPASASIPAASLVEAAAAKK
jgi:PBP1b-binding outer membrane lipoprotein LpoB